MPKNNPQWCFLRVIVCQMPYIRMQVFPVLDSQDVTRINTQRSPPRNQWHLLKFDKLGSPPVTRPNPHCDNDDVITMSPTSVYSKNLKDIQVRTTYNYSCGDQFDVFAGKEFEGFIRRRTKRFYLGGFLSSITESN